MPFLRPPLREAAKKVIFLMAVKNLHKEKEEKSFTSILSLYAYSMSLYNKVKGKFYWSKKSKSNKNSKQNGPHIFIFLLRRHPITDFVLIFLKSTFKECGCLKKLVPLKGEKCRVKETSVNGGGGHFFCHILCTI